MKWMDSIEWYSWHSIVSGTAGWVLPFTILDTPTPTSRRRAAHMPPFRAAKYQITRRWLPACTCTIYIYLCVCVCVCLLHYPHVAHIYCSTCCHTLSLLPQPSSASVSVSVSVCVNYLMVCKFATRCVCVAAWFQFCGWRKINFVAGLILPCVLPVYNFICLHCTAAQCVYVICSYSAQLYRKQEAHTNLINLKCMKAVANQHNIIHTGTHLLVHTHWHTHTHNK